MQERGKPDLAGSDKEKQSNEESQIRYFTFGSLWLLMALLYISDCYWRHSWGSPIRILLIVMLLSAGGWYVFRGIALARRSSRVPETAEKPATISHNHPSSG